MFPSVLKIPFEALPRQRVSGTLASSVLAFSDWSSSALISVTNAPISVGTSAAVTKPPLSSVCSHVSLALFLPVVCNTGRSRQSCTGPLSSSPRKPSCGLLAPPRRCGCARFFFLFFRHLVRFVYFRPVPRGLLGFILEANTVSSVVVGPSRSPNAIGVFRTRRSSLVPERAGVSTKLSSPTTIGSGAAGRLNDNPPSGEPARLCRRWHHRRNWRRRK